MTTLLLLLALLLLPQQHSDHGVAPAAGQPRLPAKLLDGMGKSNLSITTNSAQAQEFFNQGVSQLYGFWFEEAERSFLQAAKLDPNAGMAYWGIAMSAAGDFRPQYQNFLLANVRAPLTVPPGSPLARAREATVKALELAPKLSERERLYIETVAALHNPRAQSPNDDYIATLRKLVTAFPDDLDAKSILALAVENGYDGATRMPRRGTEESIALLREVLARNPDHVGALHFLIHAVEDSGHAQEALAAAEKYPLLVSRIPHALHMPGHIYIQIGRFDDAVRAFENADDLERKYMKADPQYPRGHFLHNQQFLIYALGEAGRFQAAVEKSRSLMTLRETPSERSGMAPSPYLVGWFSLMRTLVRFERWKDILDAKVFPSHEKPRELVWYNWAQGLAHIGQGDRTAARESLNRMEAAFDQFKRTVNPVPRQFYVARMELQSAVENDFSGLQHAADEEIDMPYTEPPAYPRPVLQAVGRNALRADNFHDAENAYRALLDREPSSGFALQGLYEALARQGKTAEAQATAATFEKAWPSADPDIKVFPRKF
jgi:tetratricopeptide (TPR) repeat protein